MEHNWALLVDNWCTMNHNRRLVIHDGWSMDHNIRSVNNNIWAMIDLWRRVVDQRGSVHKNIVLFMTFCCFM